MTNSATIKETGCTWVTPAMSTFFDLLTKIKPDTFTAHVTQIHSTFNHGPAAGAFGCLGPVGYSGRCKHVREEDEQLVLEFTINSDDMLAFAAISDELKLKLSQVDNKPYDCLSISRNYNGSIIIQKEVHLYHGVNEAYLAVKSFVPELTLCQFAKVGLNNPGVNEFNPELTTTSSAQEGRQYANVIHTYETQVPKPTGKSKVTLEILSSDIEKNTPVLLRYLIKYT